MKKIIILLTLLLLPITSLAENIESVSLINLISTPEKYHSEFVRVFGYLHYKFENNALYISKSDADYLIGENAIWISFSEDKKINIQSENREMKLDKESLRYFDCKYVLLEGIFNKDNRGHLGAYSGSLEGVTRIMELTQWYDGRKELKK